jgi:endonuclease III
LGDAVVTKTSATATTAVAAETTTKATKDAEDEVIAAKLLECKPAEATALANANVTKSPSILAETASAILVRGHASTVAAVAAEDTAKEANVAVLPKLLECKPAEATALANANVTKSPSILAETASVILVRGNASTVAAVAAEDTAKEANVSVLPTKGELAVSSDSDASYRDTKSVASSEDMDEVTDPAIFAGEDEATLKLVQKLAGDNLSHKSKSSVKSPANMLSSAKSQTNPVKSQTKKLSAKSQTNPVKSQTKKVASALKNLESVFDDDPFESRKRKSIKTTSSLLPSAKRPLVIKSEESTKTSSSSTSKNDSNKASLKKIPQLTKGKKSPSSTSKNDSNKASLKKTPLSPKGLHAIVNGNDIRVFVRMIDNPMMKQTFRSIVQGSPYFKEYRRNAPQEPVRSNILQNKVTPYRVIINSEWIDQQVYMLMEIDRLVTQIRRTRDLVAPRELWLRAIPKESSDRNYAYQLLFIMICSSALTDATLTQHMKSIFDLIDVVPEKVIKMTETELERILHRMGRSNMNAANILAMTKDVLDVHNGQVPADWDAITKFRGVGRKIASVVVYEAFGISRVPVDAHVLRFAKYFGWCRENATATKCQEDIEGWMPEITWYLVNSTIGSFCQLASSHKKNLYSEMDRMRIGLINPKFDMVRFLKEYVYLWESKIYSKTKG